MYLQDVGGDENFHLYLQPLDGKPAKDLTAFEGVRAQNLVTDKHFPGEVLSSTVSHDHATRSACMPVCGIYGDLSSARYSVDRQSLTKHAAPCCDAINTSALQKHCNRSQ